MPDIYLIGDSTVAKWNDKNFPMEGWGVYLADNLRNIDVYNCAESGASSRDYKTMAPAKWKTVQDGVKKGDYVLLQLAINDAIPNNMENQTPVADYKANIEGFINEVIDMEGIPVLVIPQVKLVYKDGVLTNPFDEEQDGAYRQALEDLADEYRLAVLDLSGRSHTELSAMTEDEAKHYYMFIEIHDERFITYPQFASSDFYNSGKDDPLHINIFGAQLCAELVADEIKIKIPAIAEYVK